MKEIDCFKWEYAFLSNFYPAPLFIFGRLFLNSEAAFQSQKCINKASEFAVLMGGEAKRLGKQVALRDDWEGMKDYVMFHCVSQKFFQNPELAKKLVETGDSHLVEGNTWGDRYWGVCNGIGNNKLGLILMTVRTICKERETI